MVFVTRQVVGGPSCYNSSGFGRTAYAAPSYAYRAPTCSVYGRPAYSTIGCGPAYRGSFFGSTPYYGGYGSYGYSNYGYQPGYYGHRVSVCNPVDFVAAGIVTLAAAALLCS